MMNEAPGFSASLLLAIALTGYLDSGRVVCTGTPVLPCTLPIESPRPVGQKPNFVEDLDYI